MSARFAAGRLSLTQASIATSVDATRDAEVDDLVSRPPKLGSEDPLQLDPRVVTARVDLHGRVARLW